MVQTILRLPQVKIRTGLSRSSIYAAVKRGEFPPSIALGPRAIGWDSLAIDAWIQARISAGSSKTAATAAR